MRTSLKNSFASNILVDLKDQNWLDKQRQAGKIAAQSLNLLKYLVKEKTKLSLLDLNKEAANLIEQAGGIATFKGYKGFPAEVCISVNQQLVHGIPTDYCLQEGDIVSFDLGVTIDGAIADTAITCIYGDPKSEIHVQLLTATEESLMKGIEVIAVGKRLGCIGNAISKCAKGYNFGLITQYGGHGISINTPHAAPFVSNKASAEEGIRIQPGLAIAIEPMLVIGDTKTYIDKDGWTVCGSGLSAHFEHSIFVHEDRVEIITVRD